jgi:phosphatidylglycerophosphate synthase
MAPSSYSPAEADRRPIAARQWQTSQRLANALTRAGVSPNAISVAGMACCLAAGAALAATPFLEGWASRTTWLAAAVLIQLRLLANMLDGMVAVASGRASRVGELYNELPDRISDVAALVGLGYAAGGSMELGFAAAIGAVLTAYVRSLGKAAGAAQQFIGPMAKQQRMFIVTVTAVYAGLAPEAWQHAFPLPAAALALILAGCVVTAGRRLVRIAALLRDTAHEPRND